MNFSSVGRRMVIDLGTDFSIEICRLLYGFQFLEAAKLFSSDLQTTLTEFSSLPEVSKKYIRIVFRM